MPKNYRSAASHLFDKNTVGYVHTCRHFQSGTMTQPKLKANIMPTADDVLLPEKFRPYFCQTKKALRGLGVALTPTKSPINYPGQDTYALLLQKGEKDLDEEMAYDLFLKIRHRLRAKSLPTFNWKGKVYLRWSEDSGEHVSCCETLRYKNGKAYYIFHVLKK